MPALEFLLDKVWDFLLNHINKWYSILIIQIILCISLLEVFSLIPSGRVRFLHFSYGSIAICLFVFIMWFIYVYKYPKRPKNLLGVIVAISAEESADKKFLNKDFILPLKQKVCELKLPIHILIPKKHQIDLIETQDDARYMMAKTNSHFCIWGSIKKRRSSNNDEQYIFSLNAIVIHKPIEEVQKVLLAREFSVILPTRMTFEESLQFESFEFRADQVIVALNYIMGKAALFSGDYNIAIKLHEALIFFLQSGKDFPISIINLKNLLAFEYDMKAADDFRKEQHGSYEVSVQKSLEYNERHYGALLKRAVIEFDFGRGDVRLALNTLVEAKRNGGPRVYHWLYSKTFLLFWSGKYQEAVKCCEKLKKISYQGEDSTIREVIIFNEDLLKSYTKPQLYYWLGFLAANKLHDSKKAIRYFETFLESFEEPMGDLVERARGYIVNIKAGNGL